MTGTGNGFFSGDSAPDGFEVVAANAEPDGEGEVVYAAPSVPEPSTLTLIGLHLSRQFSPCDSAALQQRKIKAASKKPTDRGPLRRARFFATLCI